jgi:hypothetical protein
MAGVPSPIDPNRSIPQALHVHRRPPMNAPALRPVAGDASYQRRAKDCDVMLLLEGPSRM